jgi:hypothetical protein
MGLAGATPVLIIAEYDTTGRRTCGSGEHGKPALAIEGLDITDGKLAGEDDSVPAARSRTFSDRKSTKPPLLVCVILLRRGPIAPDMVV